MSYGNFNLVIEAHRCLSLISMKNLGELAQIIKAELVGDPNSVVQRARPFKLAAEGDLTLAADAAYRARINESRATAVIVGVAIDDAKCNLLIAANPKLAFARASRTSLRRTSRRSERPFGSGPREKLVQTPISRVTIGRDSIVGDGLRCTREW